MALSQAERITALEVEVRSIKGDLQSANRKLDDLLALRNKGAGAFWLASALFGTTVVGFLSMLVEWMKG